LQTKTVFCVQQAEGQMTLYFLKGTSGYVKIGRTSNFDKRLSEIRRPQDTDVSVLAVFHGTDDFFIGARVAF
jgi:K+/H+ antiporter YhaU regulatory subunit KhtT